MTNKQSNPSVSKISIMDIVPYKPGRSTIPRKMIRDTTIAKPIKLSSNENPFKTSEKAIKAIIDAAKEQFKYPDGSCVELRKQISKSNNNINENNIVCGAGSDELISLICDAYAGENDEILCSEYGFLMYPISAMKVGAKVVFAKETNLKTDINNLINCITDKTKIIFIANPNNPTGSYISNEEMTCLRKNIPPQILLVIDSAYAEYVDREDYDCGIRLVESTNNTVMIKTFSKIYGLGGVRLGWAYCHNDIADVLNRVRGPFNVSDIAQKAGIAALLDVDFISKSKIHNTKWIKNLANELNNLGLRVFPSVANFLLVEFPKEEKFNSNNANKFLLEHNIIGREMDAYKLPECMRFSVGTEEENILLIKILKEFLQK